MGVFFTQLVSNFQPGAPKQRLRRVDASLLMARGVRVRGAEGN